MELLASMVELATDVCASPSEALSALAKLRAGAAEAAGENGLVIAAAGTHAFSLPTTQQIAPDPRYLEFVKYAGISARRQAVCGLHVHVGMPGPDECMAALEGVLAWLPVVLALSANSPFLAGEETGLVSARAEVLAQLPRAAAPPVFGSYGEWEAFVERFVRLGLADGYTRFWWDIRPHPQFGTLEIRAPDQPTDVELTTAFVALLQALCVTILEGPQPRVAPRGDYAQNRWAALRFGPRAELIHPDGERLAPASELGSELLELVAPASGELGTEELLGRLDPSRCEADRQLEVARAEGLEAVCADVAARTLRSTQ
jgi:carboxylate-amine ligase